MQINFLGKTNFVLKAAEAEVALAADDAAAKNSEIVVTTTDAELKVTKEQSLFDWPGEYESRDVMAMIIPVGKSGGRVIKLLIEDIAIAHLDGIAEPLTEDEESKLGSVDILLVSTGKNSGLDMKKTEQAVTSIAPSLVIPMNFEDGEEKEFAKVFGFEGVEATDNLKIKKSNLSADRMEVAILRPKK